MRPRALFMDRDGVINVDHGYVCDPSRCEFVDGIVELCADASKHGYLNIVITNQAGIARGYYSEADFQRFMEWMCGVLRQRGADITRVYHSPFHPQFGQGEYRRESDTRKPAPGMILQAARDLQLDLDRSVLVGDKETDVRAGLAAGVGCNVLFDPDRLVDRSADAAAWHVVRSLAEVSQLLAHREP